MGWATLKTEFENRGPRYSQKPWQKQRKPCPAIAGSGKETVDTDREHFIAIAFRPTDLPARYFGDPSPLRDCPARASIW
jgi:hypothetical protein